jgi:lipopolysaccharide/colanic/teichoic acid biosynthesis glycosyltransferase
LVRINKRIVPVIAAIVVIAVSASVIIIEGRRLTIAEQTKVILKFRKTSDDFESRIIGILQQEDGYLVALVPDEEEDIEDIKKRILALRGIDKELVTFHIWEPIIYD